MTKIRHSRLGMPGAIEQHDFFIFKLNMYIAGKHPSCWIGNSTEIGGINSRRPDLSIRFPQKGKDPSNAKNYDPIVTIEIAKDKRSFNYSFNAIMSAYEQAPTIQESFIYDMKEQLWYKVFKKGKIVKSSKSTILDLDFTNV